MLRLEKYSDFENFILKITNLKILIWKTFKSENCLQLKNVQVLNKLEKNRFRYCSDLESIRI
jgi:hypothetical protein